MEVNPYAYPREDQAYISHMEFIRESCRRLYDDLMLLPSSDERIIALEHLEECFWYANITAAIGETS